MQLLCFCYYLRSGEEKNFPWRENPTADLLFDPNLQQTAYIKIKKKKKHDGIIN